MDVTICGFASSSNMCVPIKSTVLLYSLYFPMTSAVVLALIYKILSLTQRRS